MNCDEVEHLLMQCDDATEHSAPDGVVGREGSHAGARSPGVERHLVDCEACAALAGKLRRLETIVRSLPEPTGESNAARMRFEAKLRSMAGEAPARRHSFVLPRRWAVAAAAVLVVTVGAATWGYRGYQQNRTLASADAIDQLVDWNLQLTQSESLAERERLYREGAAGLKQRVGNAALSDDDKQVADALMQDGAFLAMTADPLAQADRFGHVADLLVTRMGRAAKRSPKALDHLGESYLMVVDRGIKRNLDRAEAAAAAADPEEHQKRVERIIQKNIQLQKKLEALLETTPGSAQKPLRKALDATKQHAARALNKKQKAPAGQTPAVPDKAF